MLEFTETMEGMVVRVGHFDCFSGASGDMILAAALDAGADLSTVRAALASLDLPIDLQVETVKRCGFQAQKVTIHAKDQQDYRFLAEIEALIDRSSLTSKQQQTAKTIFSRLAQAEAKAHGLPIEKVHFHEIGALDSIADIIGSVVALDSLQVTAFTASPIPTGTGRVRAEHGLMPVPTPGTAELLRGVPLAKSSISAELTTPTGAAIITSLVQEYTSLPDMTVELIGHGAGTKDFLEQPNILRLFIGERITPDVQNAALMNDETFGGYVRDVVVILETNIDDTSPEMIGYCFERLIEAGALDVFMTPIQMKKHRPGILISVMADLNRVDALENMLFRETGTFGVRRQYAWRNKLHREAIKLTTPWGQVTGKRGWINGHQIITPEYEDCASLARQTGIPLREIYQSIQSSAGS